MTVKVGPIIATPSSYVPEPLERVPGGADAAGKRYPLCMATMRRTSSSFVSRRRIHDLRVSAATLLQELGVEEPVRMARLGHTTTRMARHYAVARDELDRDASTRLAEAIG